jgi:hypothetical protein
MILFSKINSGVSVIGRYMIALSSIITGLCDIILIPLGYICNLECDVIIHYMRKDINKHKRK